MASSPVERRESLVSVFREARNCERCGLSESRTQVVFGSGNADADLMFVGEAPGAEEDRQGIPFVGRSGNLLTTMLAEVGIAREDVFIANTLKCRPPGNRDPLTSEIETCRPWLNEQIRLIEPKVVASLGNFATKLLRRDPTGITRVHGQPEEQTIGERTVVLFPLFHPAAALRSKSVADLMRRDVASLAALLDQTDGPSGAR